MDFHGIDLNLLVAFDALMSERNVTRAAHKVGVSQPAMSAALARLRSFFADPVFIRSADGLLPTPRARELAEPIAQIMRELEFTLIQPAGFAAADAVMTFKLGLADYPAFVLLPPLLEALAVQAPGISVNVHAFNDRDHAVDLLHAGSIDAAIGVPPTRLDGRIQVQPLFTDEFVSIVARGHAAVASGLDMNAWLGLKHILASPEGELHGLVDQALAQLGKRRELALTLPHMFAVPALVARTGMTATLMRRVVTHSPVSADLHVFTPPVALPEIPVNLIWHRRADANPPQQWFRNLIIATAATL